MSQASISPIDQSTQERVTGEVVRYIRLASQQYGRDFESIPVRFDLKGKTAGMYRVKRQSSPSHLGRSESLERVIRFNPWLFAKYPDDSWKNTVPHEVAHYIVDCLYGLASVRPHGRQWQQVMAGFGAEPIVRARYDMSGIPTRKMRRYSYRCLCRTVELSSQRHKKIQQGIQSYRCRDCRGELVFSEGKSEK